jgi:hypothetical protein
MLRTAMLIGCIGCLGSLASCTQSPAGKADTHPRVGVYDSRAVAVAFVGSDVWNATEGKRLAALRAEYDKAKAEGDTKRMAELDAKGRAWQALMHRQGFSTAPVDDILAHIQDRLPGIAEEAGVEAIVSRWDEEALARHAEGERVDVTMALVDALKPTDRQRRAAIEIQRHAPIPLDKAGQIDD